MLAVFAAGIYFYEYDKNNPSEATVIIPKGSFKNAVDTLAENEIIRYPSLAKILVAVDGNAKKIKAGEYLFPANVSMQEAIKILVSGKVVEHRLTIPEGLTIRQIKEILSSEDKLVGDFPENIAEGSLAPDTYFFTMGDSRSAMIARMQEKMQNIVEKLWENRTENLPLKNKEEAMVLASIVEKETGVADERARVAAVFINRLRIGMRLQSDPTTIYGIEQKLGKKMEGELSLTDLKTPTPYNTYTIPALPPTPICNFGKEALEAVLHPAPTNDLYFVATGTGGHRFSSTLEEHNRNVALYRRAMQTINNRK